MHRCLLSNEKKLCEERGQGLSVSIIICKHFQASVVEEVVIEEVSHSQNEDSAVNRASGYSAERGK